MKIYLTLLFLFLTISSFSQSEKSLEETKTYIVKMIDDYGINENYKVEFSGDLLKTELFRGNFLGSPMVDKLIYNFKNVYKFKGPIRKPGNIGELIIWVDASLYSNNKWGKKTFKLIINDYEAAEQLMIAFKHLNKLLKQEKSIEKF